MRSLLISFAMCLAFTPVPANAAISLKLGDVSVTSSALVSGGCIQVPVIINDPISRDLRDVAFTVSLSGDTGVIAGGIAANMVVANSYVPAGAGMGLTGITNPGTDLSNSNGTATPGCAHVFNRATQGQGSPINFPAGTGVSASWGINNNQAGVGRKQGFLIDFETNASLGMTQPNTDILIAVLEIPIIPNPGAAQLQITATPEATLSGGNAYTYESGVQVFQNFQLPSEPALVKIGPLPIQLKLGSVSVTSTELAAGGCIQVPIIINDSIGRFLSDIAFTVSLSGETSVIAGGIAANMVVANSYLSAGGGVDVTGITNPGTDLSNRNGEATPGCTHVFNRATQGQAAPIDFATGINVFAGWAINNNQGEAGRKQGFLVDLVSNSFLGATLANTDVLIAVLEIPIIPNPGTAQLQITATPEATVPNGNTYTFGSPQSTENFILPGSPSIVRIVADLIFIDSFENTP